MLSWDADRAETAVFVLAISVLFLCSTGTAAADGYVDINPETPYPTDELERGETYTFEFTADCDLGGSDEGYLAISVRENSWGDIGKYQTVNQESGSVDISITEDIGEDWDQAMLVVNLYPEEEGCPGDGCTNSVIDDNSITYDLTGGTNPPIFQVSNLNPTETNVKKGEFIYISATITNTGGEGYKDVDLWLDDSTYDTKTLHLYEGDSDTVEFGVDTSDARAGENYFAIQTQDDSQDGILNVETTLPEIERDYPSSRSITRTEGEEVSFDVMATRSDGGLEEVDWYVDGNHYSTEYLSGSYGYSSLQNSFEASGDSSRTYTIKAQVTDENGNTDAVQWDLEVEPEPEATFEITRIEVPNNPVEEGNDIVVDAYMTNTGEASGTRTVTANVDSLGSDSGDLYLYGDDSGRVSLEIPTYEGDAGSYTVEVQSPKGTATREITVKKPPKPFFEISSIETDSPVEKGDNIVVDAEVSNVGGAEGRQTVTADLGSIGVEERSVYIDAGQSERLTFEFPTSRSDIGDHVVKLRTGGKSETSRVVVDEGEVHSIRTRITPNEVEPGEEITVEATIENPSLNDITVLPDIEGRTIGEESVTSQRETVRFYHEFSDPGEKSISIVARDSYGRVKRDHSTVQVRGDAPIINDRNPDGTQLTSRKGKRIAFDIKAEDPYGRGLQYEWYVNGELVDSGGSSLTHTFSKEGRYEVRCEVANELGFSTVQNWVVRIDGFDKSPTLASHSTAEEIEVTEQDEIVTFSFHHPGVNQEDAVVDMKVEVPNGISVSGARDVDTGDAAQLVSLGDVPPGRTKDMSLDINVEDESLIGQEVDFSYEVLYHSEEDPSGAIGIKKNNLELEVEGEENAGSSRSLRESEGNEQGDEEDDAGRILGYVIVAALMLIGWVLAD
jgi:hypothetical protein